MQKQQSARVEIVNVNLPFLALVGLIVKISLASIPAALILGLVVAIVAAAVFVGLMALGQLPALLWS
jgi:hypothetical protein